MSANREQEKSFGGDFYPTLSVKELVEKAREYRGSYILTQPILDSLVRIISTNSVDEEPNQELLDAWDEIAAIVNEAKQANLGPNLGTA